MYISTSSCSVLSLFSNVIYLNEQQNTPGSLLKKFEDTKGFTRSRNSYDRQYNYQKKNDKETMVDTVLHRKLKIEEPEPR